MQITVVGDIKSLVIDGVEMVKPKLKNLADAFREHLGTKEYSGVVAKIQKWYYGSLIKDAWCTTALSYFSNECGLLEQTGKHENVDRMKDYMNKRGKIKMSKAYGGDYIPKKGDVVFFSGKNTYADCTHVGAILSIEGDMITWVAGNTSDKIDFRTHNMKTNKYVVCFGEIDY